MSNRKTYYLVSGEGGRGTWETVVTTPLGIKQRLTHERSGGDRWAKAYADPYETTYGDIAGHDVETGNLGFIPSRTLSRTLRTL